MNFQLPVKTSTPLFYLVVSLASIHHLYLLLYIAVIVHDIESLLTRRFVLVQKRLREKHGRMENLQVFNRIAEPGSIMADVMKTFDDYGIRGAPKSSEPVVISKRAHDVCT